MTMASTSAIPTKLGLLLVATLIALQAQQTNAAYSSSISHVIINGGGAGRDSLGLNAEPLESKPNVKESPKSAPKRKAPPRAKVRGSLNSNDLNLKTCIKDLIASIALQDPKLPSECCPIVSDSPKSGTKKLYDQYCKRSNIKRGKRRTRRQGFVLDTTGTPDGSPSTSMPIDPEGPQVPQQPSSSGALTTLKKLLNCAVYTVTYQTDKYVDKNCCKLVPSFHVCKLGNITMDIFPDDDEKKIRMKKM